MRSAIYFPETQIRSAATMCSALLMLDQVKVIVPWDGFSPQYQQSTLAQAWELVGGTMHPDTVQQKRAHKNICELLESELPINAYYRADAPPEDVYELWPQKLLPQTWDLLRKRSLTSAPLASGDYPFQEQAALAIMAKLADACAGGTFARWTDRFLAYGLVADRDPTTAAHTAVVPMTLSMINAGSIPIERLIDFRQREQRERRGGDYRDMRHRYADAILKHIEATKSVESSNELQELRRQFRDDMEKDLRDLRDALGFNMTDAITSPVVVSTVVSVGSWLATKDPIVALAAGGIVPEAIKRVAELFKLRQGFSAKQRKVMSEHPMAYVYQLGRTHAG
jgi:hypothetical protein